jgi:3-deoxy-manno-octulosonate cytidylyltransferase (CMP-KDO synthetase)
MKILGVIPARYGASRFPGKPLADIGGTTMVQRVYEQCAQATGLAGVVVATEDERIAAHVRSFGGEAALTSAACPTGTERVAEVAAQRPGFDAYINIQGDEPFIAPEAINAVCACLLGGAEIATLARPWDPTDDLHNPNLVKVVRNALGDALYFSRSAIPFVRGREAANTAEWLQAAPFFKHLGIYGFRREVLLRIPAMPPAVLEQAESLEQLRWLFHGFRIQVGLTAHDSIAIDVPADVDKALAYLASMRS